MQEDSAFTQEKQRWEGLLDSSRKEIISEQDYNEFRGKIHGSIEEFYTQI
jgi:hypothetical protein